MTYLIVGLGNIGQEYAYTRHNVGFMILDQWAKEEGLKFTQQRLAYHTQLTFKGRNIHLIKPTTYMNLSGNALHYWMKELKLTQSNLLVLVDDLALPFGSIKLKPKGGHAGHNGLKNIELVLSSNAYARLRFGIGDNFPRGRQADYVLSRFTAHEEPILQERIDDALSLIKSFVSIGIELTMTAFNKKT